MTKATYQAAHQMDLKTVNIASEMDWSILKYDWMEKWHKDGNSFERIREIMSQVNVVVGFGRGFWKGVSGYSYLVFSPKNDAFYWYVHHSDEEDQVSFYRIPDDARILELLKTKVIEENFEEYDRTVSYSTMYTLTKRYDNVPYSGSQYKLTELTEVFGEDTEELRAALAIFHPAASGNNYPHIEYQEGHFKPFIEQQMKRLAEAYNTEDKKVFSHKRDLFIEIGGETFKLMPIERNEKDDEN